METAAFGAGCFWGVEVAFRNVEGVADVTVGYMGGATRNPTYDQVCTGLTNHAEVVEVRFDPEKVNYDQLLDVFWEIHDPTQPDRQGPDVGTQYRSVVFAYDETQLARAKASREALAQSRKHRRKIATQIVKPPAPAFYPAEDYHQQFLVKRGLATCRL